jgi:chromosome segregation ATPase
MHLIAAQMVAQSEHVGQLLAELEACSLPIGDPPRLTYVDCAAVLRDQQMQRVRFDEAVSEREEIRAERDAIQAEMHQREAALDRINAQLAEQKKENELLLLQLHQVQEELERVFQDSKRLDESCTVHVAERERLEARLAELNAACEEQERRTAGVIEDRDRRVQQSEARIAELERSCDEQTRLATNRKAELGQLQSTLESAEAGNREVKQENELLLLQLHQVQEELESYYLQLQSTSARLKRTDAELEKAVESLSGADEKLRKAEEMLSLAERKIGYRDRRIQYLENSRSWKMTAPVRAILSLFRRPVRSEGDAS